jgi:hypothetical protein
MRRSALAALLLVALAGCGAFPATTVSGGGRSSQLAAGPAPSPASEVAAFADRTTMTALARDIFYRARPELQSRARFTSSCPAQEKRQILGCYIGGRIFILLIDRPELAEVMDVTAAHEMLHAAYDDLGSDERKRVDGWTTHFYEGTGSRDPELKQLVEKYPESQRTNELHSLLGTQVAALSPELERYYARYFTDRAAVVQEHAGSDAVFTGIERQHAELLKQINSLVDQIHELAAQQADQAAEAQRLGAQITDLRAQGRVAESNALVAKQNAAAQRATDLEKNITILIDQHNEKVRQINDLVFRQDQLVKSLGSG